MYEHTEDNDDMDISTCTDIQNTSPEPEATITTNQIEPVPQHETEETIEATTEDKTPHMQYIRRYVDILGESYKCVQSLLYIAIAKNKLNTKSSTESEVVCVSDVLSHKIWAKCVLEVQCNGIYDRNIFYKDNTSTIRMLQNGKSSCGKQDMFISVTSL